MVEYIELEAAFNTITDLAGKASTRSAYEVIWKSARALKKIPAADVAPVVHGKWGTHSDRPDSLICSVCNCGFDMWKHDPHNYCPNCGAKMDGAK